MSSSLPWWKTGVIYQIYVRSFADSNGDGIGDLNGIIEHLDYLNDGTPNSLGVDAIWLTPFYASPDRDFGYDVSDYRSVHPQYGTMADFERLTEEAHKRGIRIIVDFVPNHTSDEHPWFVESRASKDNPKRDWYIWRDGKDGGPPNNWQAAPGGCAWEYDEKTDQYYYHAFFDFQPDLNWRNPEVRQAVIDDMRFWLDKGADGFRLDLINYLIEDDDFRDNGLSFAGWYMGKFQDTTRTRDLHETHEVLKSFRAMTDEYKDRMMVGEIVSYPWEGSPAATYSNNEELHLAFNMELLAIAMFRAGAFRRVVDDFESKCPADGWPAYVLSNHDVPRHIGRLAGKLIYGHRSCAFERAKVCAALLMTLRGTPFLYYGEELGMTNRWFGPRDIVDPLGKKVWPLYQGRDACRTPMLWKTGHNAGFSSGKPWLPIDPQADLLCAATAGEEPKSLLNFYRRLIWLRKDCPALNSGSYRSVTLNEHGELFAFKRISADQHLLVILNFSGKASLPIEIEKGQVLLSTHERPETLGGRISLMPYEVLILESKLSGDPR